jgi:hypothetical protein
MKRLTFGFSIAAYILFLCAAMFSYAASAGLSMSRDGWVSWQVPAVADAPNWCCFGALLETPALQPNWCKFDFFVLRD